MHEVRKSGHRVILCEDVESVSLRAPKKSVAYVLVETPGDLFPVREEYTLNAINPFLIKEKYILDSAISSTTSLRRSTRRTKG